MDSKELRQEFLNFFEKRGHKIMPSSSLIPEDKTVLLTSAGMQQFIPYLSGEKNVLEDLGTQHLASVQKCFRTPDIDKVGDDTHHTFFEMLGNWSIGEDPKKGYFKEGAIKLALDFFVDTINLDKNKFWVTIFKGEKAIPRDEESLKIWQKYGISPERIVEFGLKDNFWGPIAETGPCGPCSEIHYDRGKEYGCKDLVCAPNCQKCNRFVELWNLVFMEYNKNEQGLYDKLPQRNVDTGIGFERLVALLQNKNSAYETDLFKPTVKKLEEISGREYEENKRIFRIITDHIRGSVFLISEGILPSNVERGYILRKILRRAIRYGRILRMENNFLIPLAQNIIENYESHYPEVKSKQETVLTVIQNEEEKFEKTLERGLKQLDRLLKKNKTISGKEVFYLYETFGFPLELTEEIAGEQGINIDKESFQQALKEHQKISRAGAEKKFGGLHPPTTRQAGYQMAGLHTATHLLHQALRDILGSDVKQMGSDINSQRLRFDFSYSQKMNPEEIKKVEEIVNQKIKEDLVVKKEEMALQNALISGALAFFKEKYPEKVTVYSMIDSSGKVFSKEVCAGPHVKRTSELEKFKITKEESCAAGVRRVRGILIK